MKPGKLFEEALKQANLTLKSGKKIQIQVRGKGAGLRLVVLAEADEFDSTILRRAQEFNAETHKPYKPELPTGERIRALRKGAGMTLQGLANKAGLSKGTLCSIENGNRPVGLTILRRIAKALGVSISSLIG